MARTRSEHVVGAAHIDVIVFLRRAPGTDLTRAVHDRIDAFGRREHVVGIGDVAAARFDTRRCGRRRGTIERTHHMAARKQLRTDRAAEKSATAGNQNLHRRSSRHAC